MKNILLIDDSENFYRIINNEIFEKNESFKNLVTLTYANNGFDGIVEVGKSKPDLIILDFSMIGLNGFETASKVASGDDELLLHKVFLKNKNGNLWFGTKWFGLSRYDGKTFTTFSQYEN